MNYDDYEKWLNPSRGDKLVEKHVQTAEQFEDFLRTERSGKLLETAPIKDFRSIEGGLG